MRSNDFNKNLLFGYLACLRLYPNYVFFSQENNFGNPAILKDYLNSIRTKITDPNFKVDFGDYEEVINKITPTPHEFESVLASSAMDVCAAIYELIVFIQDNDLNRIDAISTLATDSVDMYLQEKEGLEMDDPKFEEKLSFHPLMIRERKTQRDIWEYLEKVQTIDLEDIATLEQLQFNKGMGNLDLVLR